MKLWLVMAPTHILNIYSGYSMYDQYDPLQYKSDFRIFLKKQSGLYGWTVDHHIFPKCLSRHPVLNGMNINCGKNLINKHCIFASCIFQYLISPFPIGASILGRFWFFGSKYRKFLYLHKMPLSVSW